MLDIIAAGSGMGKSSSMAYFAMKWVKDEKGGEYTQQYYINQFLKNASLILPIP